MKKLYIVGAGGFGREVFQWASDCAEYDVEWRIAGFIDDNKAALDGFDYPVGVVGSVSHWQPAEDELFVLAIGYPEVKRKCAEPLLQRGAKFITLVHPKAVIGRNVKIGQGCVICPYAVLSVDISVGDFSALYFYSALGHDVELGPWSQLSAYCDLTGGVKAGHSLFMGTHASILPRLKIGNEVTIGAGSVVMKDVPDGKTVFGIPARVV